MKSPVGSFLLFALVVGAVASCPSKSRHGEATGAPAADPGAQPLQLARTEEAVLTRARAIAKLDPLRAIESLRRCDSTACRDERAVIATQGIERLGTPPFADTAGLQTYLRLQAAAGKDRVCALILALATRPKPEAAMRDTLTAAVKAETDSVRSRLGGRDPDDVELTLVTAACRRVGRGGQARQAREADQARPEALSYGTT